MSIQHECNFGIGFIVSPSDELNEILEQRYDDDFYSYLEEITENTDFRPIQKQEHLNSDYEFAIVYKKTFKELMSVDYTECEQFIIDFIKKHKLNIKSEFDVVGGIFFY